MYVLILGAVHTKAYYFLREKYGTDYLLSSDISNNCYLYFALIAMMDVIPIKLYQLDSTLFHQVHGPIFQM